AKLRGEVDKWSRRPLQAMPNSPSPGKDNSEVYDETKRTLAALSAYMLTKDDRYYQESLRLLKNIGSWDPNGPTANTRHGLDMGARTMTFAMTLGYDWLYPRLGQGTRDLLLSNVKIRLGQMQKDVIGQRSRVAQQPRDSHAQLTATMLGMMSTLLVGDI